MPELVNFVKRAHSFPNFRVWKVNERKNATALVGQLELRIIFRSSLHDICCTES